jgi:gp45 sliding clamp, C terminal./DNA polymerase processivity factor.
MKLSTDTVNLLKNFASINSNIVVQEGNVLRTMAEAKNVMARAEVAETFEGGFGIYDLGEFLSVYNMFDQPDLDFADDMNSVTMREGRAAVKYFFSDPEILTTPSKDITMPAVDVNFTLSSDDLASIRKASSALGVSELVVTKEGDTIVGVVTDTKNSTANSFKLELQDATSTLDSDFKFVFSIPNFKLTSGDYNVDISSKLISKFTNEDGTVYFIALEKSSSVGG